MKNVTKFEEKIFSRFSVMIKEPLGGGGVDSTTPSRNKVMAGTQQTWSKGLFSVCIRDLICFFVFNLFHHCFSIDRIKWCHFNNSPAKFVPSLLTACKISNKPNKRLLMYCTFIFPISCRIVSVRSYLRENEATNLQNGDVPLVQTMGYLENDLSH